MQIKRAIVSLALLCVVTTSSQILGAEGWLTNWEEAKKTAAKEKKDILIDFTGSDWCGWCIKLKNEVFTKDQFKKEAPKDFVLLELDFPRSKPQAPELKKQNASLRDRFGIQGYPTIMLVDAPGAPCAPPAPATSPVVRRTTSRTSRSSAERRPLATKRSQLPRRRPTERSGRSSSTMLSLSCSARR